jgi:hypothetical protein
MRLAPALTLLMLAAAPAPARADPCDARLRFVADRLDADARAGRIHEGLWAAGNGAIAVGLFTIGVKATDRGARAGAYIGAAGSLLAMVAPFVLDRVPAIADAPRLERAIAATPDGPARCALVPTADRLLARSARDERFARGLWSHAINVAINAAGWLVIGLGWHQWTTSGLGALLSIGLGEVQIYTRPSGALRAWTVAPAFAPGEAGFVFASPLP